MSVLYILGIYTLVINLIAFLTMGLDKQKARKRSFRIPEATLFTIAIIGGSIGSIAGMYVFRHKTRHRYFQFGMPAILILQVIFLLFLIFGPFKIILF